MDPEEYWNEMLVDLPWLPKVQYVHEVTSDLILSWRDPQRLRLVMEDLQVFVVLTLGPPARWLGLSSPPLILGVELIVARQRRQGMGTQAMRVLMKLADDNGWGLVLEGPFNAKSRGMATKLGLCFAAQEFGAIYKSKVITFDDHPRHEAKVVANPLAGREMAAASAAPKKPKHEPRVAESAFTLESNFVTEVLRGGDETVRVRAHQRQAAFAIQDALKGKQGKAVLVQVPTGGGKTGMAVLSAYVVGAKRVLVVTPSQIISVQNYDAFAGRERSKRHDAEKPFMVKYGVFEDNPVEQHNIIPSIGIARKSRDIPGLRSRVVLIANAHKATERTTTKINDLPKDYDLVIIDEAHHYPAKTWKDLVKHFEGSNRLFLTATGDGLEGLGIEKIFQVSRQDLVRDGVIRDLNPLVEAVGPEDKTAVFKVSQCVLARPWVPHLPHAGDDACHS